VHKRCTRAALAVSHRRKIRQTASFYKNFLGRDSYDARGARLVSTVHSTFSAGTSCSPNNAAWLGHPYNQMAYGDGDGQLFLNLTRAVDITGHELTHAVTGATSKLVYQDEPGALNEAISDIFGVATVAWQRGGGTPAGNPAQLLVDSKTWQVGGAAAGPALGGALRYMNDRIYRRQRSWGRATQGRRNGARVGSGTCGSVQRDRRRLAGGGEHPTQP
jgi:bacillolysin